MHSDAQRQLNSRYNALKIGRRCPLFTITVGVRLADRFATGLVLATICPLVLAAPVAFSRRNEPGSSPENHRGGR